MRYFGRKFTAHHSVSMSGGSWEIKYSPGTKRYTIQMTDSEQKAYAHVENAKKIPNGNIKMTGILGVKKRDEEVPQGTFKALARLHKGNGNDTWALLSLKYHAKK